MDVGRLLWPMSCNLCTSRSSLLFSSLPLALSLSLSSLSLLSLAHSLARALFLFFSRSRSLSLARARTRSLSFTLVRSLFCSRSLSLSVTLACMYPPPHMARALCRSMLSSLFLLKYTEFVGTGKGTIHVQGRGPRNHNRSEACCRGNGG